MFSDSDLINHLQTRNSIDVDSLIIAEWNQNDLLNLDNYGNYRYRPDSASVVYRTLYPEYDSQDNANVYTDALDSNYTSEYKTQDPNEPFIFTTKETSRELYYSLKDCIKPFRPRSGINKMIFFGEDNLNNEQFVDSIRSGGRPRYYFSSRFDKFKYWNSYRQENGIDYGISSKVATFFTTGDPSYKINDCAPFIVYKNDVATNRIVVKMQTNLADPTAVGMSGDQLVSDNIRKQNVMISDPLKDIKRSSVPKRWKIQYLDSNNNWTNAISFNETSTRRDGSRIVPWDGHVEIYYGIKIPEKFKTNFHLYGYLDTIDQLPDPIYVNRNVVNGDSYVVGSSTTEAGTLYIWDQEEQEWLTYSVEYGFSLLEDDDTKRVGLIKKILNPDYFVAEGVNTYRDFVFVKGIRVVVETMYAPNKPFDLIELSPRLKVDLTDYVLNYDINKNLMATDFGLPVGGLVASTGGINLSNHDGVFTELNTFNTTAKTGSIIANNLKPQIKFDFYEAILDVNGYDKFIPLKTFYSENAAVATSGMQDVSLNLRDAYFILESNNATPIFLQNCTLTMAVALLLDNIGFSNYVFKNINTANDPVVPFFFIEPDASVAEILQRLAQATQTAMFFDEYNNFVVMPKEYLMPDISIRDDNSSISERLTTLYGQRTNSIVPNIETISGFETKILNDGQINYTTRYIQREVSRLEQAGLSLSERTYGYKSSVLWELGDQKNNNEYQKYFSQLAFNGKMTLTGLLRIYVEPYYENASGSNFEELEENVRYKNGSVRSHGRGQFGTTVTSHFAGLSSYWENLENRQSFRMDSDKIFDTKPLELLPNPSVSNTTLGSPLGNDLTSKNQSSITSKIANFMKQSTRSEGFSSYNQQSVAGIQSSALVFNGPYPVPFSDTIKERDLVNYVYKNLDTDYTHVGTRMRIIGKQKDDKNQSALNSIKLFDINQSIGNSDVKELSGGAGGIGYMIDPNTNSGYYLEIASLSSDILSYFSSDKTLYTVDGNTVSASVVSASTIFTDIVENIIFYKVERTPYSSPEAGKENIAVPRKLWGSLARILVDEGKFIGSDRLTSQEIPVYDLSLDVQRSGDGSKINFSIYLNNTLIGAVTDNNPLPMPQSGLKVGLFTRGSSKCMFENIYAIKNVRQADTTLPEKIDESFSTESLRKYSLPAAIQRTYLSSIGTETKPTVDFYFEEFGTILRECAYFNIKYDQAYPALLAKIVPPFTSEKSYEVSGFLPGSYGAEFLIFNTTDKAIDLSESSTNRIMIQGITFTQNISNVLTVDDYFKELSNFSDPVITNNNLIVSPGRSEKIYESIRNSRSVYGNKSFSLNSVYIQNEDSAKDIMKWILDKTIRPRKVFEIDTFGTAHVQLGDIVKINFDLPEGVKMVDENKKFVVISAQYGRSSSNVKSQLRVMEV